MSPPDGCEDSPEASQFNRRQYLTAAGALVSGGLTLASGNIAAATDSSIEIDTATVNHNWKSVQLTSTHSDPVVIAPALSYSGTNPASPRLRNVTESSFELTVEEWMYLDGRHLDETVGYFATDIGEYSPTDGPVFEVGRVHTDHRWGSVSFATSFSETPIVFTNAQTVNGSHPIVTRNGNVDKSGMKARLQEEEAEGPHRTEAIGYLAVSAGTGTIDGNAVEAGMASEVDHRWQRISFSDTYRDPIFLADVQTYRGNNPVSIRYRNLSESSVEVKLHEEQSANREMGHVRERVGYLVFEKGSDTAAGYGMGGFGNGGFGQ